MGKTVSDKYFPPVFGSDRATPFQAMGKFARVYKAER
jgi:hypothetical protein